MAKNFKLIGPQQPSASGTNLPCLTDWNQCVLCQKDTIDPFSCPVDSKRLRGFGYQTFTDNLASFSQIGCLPRDLDVSCLDDAEGIQLTFQNYKTKWHHSCRLQYNTTELIRAQMRKPSSRQTEGVSRKYTRQSGYVDHTHSVPETCFFCDKTSRRRFSACSFHL